nr:MAG TPA: hypothetical protein [Caudoviricetes sp.]
MQVYFRESVVLTWRPSGRDSQMYSTARTTYFVKRY